MAQEYGFKFDIKGTVFIAQASKSGSDVVAAYQAAMLARKLIVEVLGEMPDHTRGMITVGAPMAASRRAAETATGTASKGDGDSDPPTESDPEEDGPEDEATARASAEQREGPDGAEPDPNVRESGGPDHDGCGPAPAPATARKRRRRANPKWGPFA